MIVELGCGVTPTERADIHHDRIRHADYIDVAWDLQDLPWPWADDSIDELIAIDVFEHLTLFMRTRVSPTSRTRPRTGGGGSTRLTGS